MLRTSAKCDGSPMAGRWQWREDITRNLLISEPGTMDKLTTTIKREWLREIIAGRKRVEYRQLKPYWTKKLATVKVPFSLRLINGMSKNAPEVTVVVNRVHKNSRTRQYELRIGRVVRVKRWNRRTEQPLSRV